MLDIVTNSDLVIFENIGFMDNGSVISESFIDTADFSPGITFFFFKNEGATGESSIKILESEEVEGIYTEVPSESLIGSLDGTVDSVLTYGDRVPSVGVFSSKRYLRIELTRVGAVSPDTLNVLVFCLLSPEVI